MPSPAALKGKGRIRALVHRGVGSGKRRADSPGAFKDPTVCERCGAIYSRKTWRRRRRVGQAFFARAAWAVCPACLQVERGQFFGRVIVRGAFADAHEEAILRRIRNVADRARFTQPERRIVDIRFDGQSLQVLTNSQQLAHRIAHELQKAFGGRANYVWSDWDGRLLATWERHDAGAGRSGARERA